MRVRCLPPRPPTWGRGGGGGGMEAHRDSRKHSSAACPGWPVVVVERLLSSHGIDQGAAGCGLALSISRWLIEHWCVRAAIWQKQLDVSVDRDAGRCTTVFLQIQNRSHVASFCMHFLLRWHRKDLSAVMPACRWGHLYEYCSADYEPGALEEESRGGIAAFAARLHQGTTGWQGDGAPMHDPHDPTAVSAPLGLAPLRPSSVHQLLRMTAEPRVRNGRHHERSAEQRFPEANMQRWARNRLSCPGRPVPAPPSSRCTARPPRACSLRARMRTHRWRWRSACDWWAADHILGSGEGGAAPSLAADVAR